MLVMRRVKNSIEMITTFIGLFVQQNYKQLQKTYTFEMQKEFSKKIAFKSPKGPSPHEVHAELLKLNDEQLWNSKDEQDSQISEQLLSTIFEKVKQCMYSLNRKRYYGYLTVYFNNLAYFHHQNNDLDAAQNAYDECIQNYESLKGFLSTRQQNIDHTLELVRMFLRFCAILSQNGSHGEAFRYAEKAVEKLIDCIRTLRVLCQQEINLPLKQQNLSGKQHLYKIDRVNFKNIVLEQAKTLLDELVNLSPPHKVIFEQRVHYDRIMNHIYSWKDNEGVAQKLLKKQLQLNNISKKRNLLGLPKSNKNLQDFEMGKLMTIPFKKLNILHDSTKISLLVPQKIKQIGLIASMCYFTAGTQRRFHQIDQDMQQLNIVIKYQKLSKNQQITKCKIMHLKAIQLAGKIAPQASNYFKHLINSFNKNYKAVLDQIKEESMIEQSVFINGGCEQSTVQYGLQTTSNKKKKTRRRITHNEQEIYKHKICKLFKKYGVNQE